MVWGRRDAELGSAEVAGLQRARRGSIEQFLTVLYSFMRKSVASEMRTFHFGDGG